MGGTLYLFLAFGISWMIFFIYLFSMVKRQKRLEIQMDRIKDILEKTQDR